ncbi:MAG TPA: PilZ domain-containing protein [Terriglobales bacterium]|nr:PilZ domain-containing protein [Terriglobales bacterium]
MAERQQDKRATRRFSLRLPISVKYQDGATGEKTAYTRDVSARGICFYLDSPMGEGTEIEFTLTLPPEITLTESIRVRCKGTVVRAEQANNNGQMSVAAVINEYEFLAES